MECSILNRDWLWIVLSPQEMRGWGISVGVFDCSDEARRKWLCEILRLAGERTGYKRGKRTQVEFFPRKDGSCELYVGGWESPPREESLYLFDSLDHFLFLRTLLSDEEKNDWGKGVPLPSGRWVMKYHGMVQGKEALWEDFATLLTGEYLWEYLSEYRERL